MKKNETKKSTKEYKNMLSPSFKRNKMTFSQDLFKDLETNKMPLTQKRSQNKLFLNKQKVVPHRNHQRYKSNLENYPENITNAENIIGTNPSISQMSFYAKNKPKEKGKEKEKYVDYKTYIKNSVSRNVKSSSNNTNQLIKFDNDNILSFTCSLKDFRNFVINSCSSKNNFNLPKNNHNYYNNEIKSKKNKSLFSTDYISNIEDTNNTTSINNNISNSKLIYSKQIISEKGKQKKYIKINRKHSRKLYSSMDNNLKINYINDNYSKNNEETKEKDKISPKYNLHHFIYNHSNIKTKTNSYNTNTNCSNKINKYNYNTSTNQNNLSTAKKSLRNSEKYFPRIKKDKKLSIINSEAETYYDVPCTYYRSENEYNKDMPASMVSPKKSKVFNKSNFPSTTTNQNKSKIKNIFTFSKNKLGRQKSQENHCYLKQNINGPMPLSTINEFSSVEEIHFMFVQISQSKKQFFEKYEKIKK
jgi:CCR4-NOT transcription complex subunit 6